MSHTRIAEIHNETEYQSALARIRQLWALPRTTKQDQELAALARMAADWDRQDGPLSQSSTTQKRLAVLENLMEHRGLEPLDLASLCGGEAEVRRILSGEEPVSDAMARLISEKFGLAWTLFE